MDVKEAVRAAKQHLADLYASESIVHLGLEEVEYDDSHEQWRITLGFSRPWDQPFGILTTQPSRRTYKVVVIANDGKAISVRNRETADAR